MQPKITVITVSYNAQNTIEKTIKSVLEQHYENLEYIIIDGGSTDGTVGIIQKYSDFITYWISEPDAGLYDAMNKGLRKATGKYIHFLNCGDYYARGALKNAAYYMQNTDADVICGKIVQVTGRKLEVRPPDPLECINWYMMVCHQAVFIKNTGDRFFDTKYKIAADYKMLLEMYLEQKSFQYIPYEIAYFVTGGISSNCYDRNIEFMDIASRALVQAGRNIDLYRPQIINEYLESENRHLFEIGENHGQIIEFIHKYIINTDRVIIFGSGKVSRSFIGVLERAECKIQYLVDNNEALHGKSISRYPVLNPQILTTEKNASLIVMSEIYCDQMLDEIEDMELDESVAVYDYLSLKSRYDEEVRDELLERGKKEHESLKQLIEL